MYTYLAARLLRKEEFFHVQSTHVNQKKFGPSLGPSIKYVDAYFYHPLSLSHVSRCLLFPVSKSQGYFDPYLHPNCLRLLWTAPSEECCYIVV